MDIFKGIDSIFRIQSSYQSPKGKRQWLRRMAKKLENRADAFANTGDFAEADDLNAEAMAYRAAADDILGNF